MAITTLTSREFNQDVSRAKRAANKGLVIVTDRGCPSHVLLSTEAYQRLNGKHNPHPERDAFIAATALVHG